MLVNEYRLEIQFKKIQKIRNINKIPTVGSRQLECKPAQNVCAERMRRTDFTWSLRHYTVMFFFYFVKWRNLSSYRLGKRFQKSTKSLKMEDVVIYILRHTSWLTFRPARNILYHSSYT